MAVQSYYRPSYLVDPPIVRCLRTRVTLAQINAGFTLLPALPRLGYRIVDISMIAIGGNAGVSTSVDINSTQGGSAVKPIVALIAAVTRSAWVRPNTANVTALADGAAFVLNDLNTAITVGKAGGTMTTLTHLDIVIQYVIESQ